MPCGASTPYRSTSFRAPIRFQRHAIFVCCFQRTSKRGSNYLASESVSLFTPWRVAEHVPRLKTYRAARSMVGAVPSGFLWKSCHLFCNPICPPSTCYCSVTTERRGGRGINGVKERQGRGCKCCCGADGCGEGC